MPPHYNGCPVAAGARKTSWIASPNGRLEWAPATIVRTGATACPLASALCSLMDSVVQIAVARLGTTWHHSGHECRGKELLALFPFLDWLLLGRATEDGTQEERAVTICANPPSPDDAALAIRLAPVNNIMFAQIVFDNLHLPAGRVPLSAHGEQSHNVVTAAHHFPIRLKMQLELLHGLAPEWPLFPKSLPAPGWVQHSCFPLNGNHGKNPPSYHPSYPQLMHQALRSPSSLFRPLMSG